MPELLVDVLVSLDGSARGARSPGYFGYGGPDLDRWIADQDATPHVQLLGRTTYDVLDGLPAEARDEGYDRMTRTPSIVFSRTLDAVTWPGATLHAGDAAEEVARLKAGDGPDLRTVGSLSLARSLLAAGLVDRLRLLVFPLVLGESGDEPFFAGTGDLGLELLRTEVLDGTTVLTEYRPAGAPPYA